jgi:hypothetical protein
MKEGWDLFECQGVMEIERDDELTMFVDDDAALGHVLERAAAGDSTAIKALYVRGQPADAEAPRNVLLVSLTDHQRAILRMALGYLSANLDDAIEACADGDLEGLVRLGRVAVRAPTEDDVQKLRDVVGLSYDHGGQLT